MEEKADPKKFTQVADGMVEALARANLSAYQFAVVWRIIGGTWGQRGPEGPARVMKWDYARVAKEIGGKKSHIEKAMTGLLAARMIVVDEEAGTVGMNIRVGQWDSSIRSGSGFFVGWKAVRNGQNLEPKRTKSMSETAKIAETASETAKLMSETDEELSETAKSMSETDKKTPVGGSNARAVIVRGESREVERQNPTKYPTGQPAWMRNQTWAYVLKLEPRITRLADDTPNLGTLPDGKPDTPANRASLGNDTIRPENHPEFLRLGFDAQNRLAEAYDSACSSTACTREEIDTEVRVDWSKRVKSPEDLAGERAALDAEFGPAVARAKARREAEAAEREERGLMQ